MPIWTTAKYPDLERLTDRIFLQIELNLDCRICGGDLIPRSNPRIHPPVARLNWESMLFNAFLCVQVSHET